MPISATNQLLDRPQPELKPLDATNAGLTASAAAASEYISRYNDDLAIKGSDIDKSVAQTMRSALNRSNLVASIIIESTEVMAAISSNDQRETFVQSFGAAGAIVGGLLGGALFGTVGTAASPVIGAIAAGAGIGLGGFVGEELAEGLARSLLNLIDDETDSEATGASTDQRTNESEVSAGPLSERELASYDYAGFNDELDFASTSTDSSSLADTEGNLTETPRSSLTDFLVLLEDEASIHRSQPVIPFDNVVEIVEREVSSISGINQGPSRGYAGDILANQSSPTTTPQPPAYANDYLANLSVSQPVPSTSEVTNDINSYVDDIEFDDPGYINTTFHEVGYIGSDVDGSTFGNFSDFDGYSDFGADNDAGISTSGGGDAFGGDFGDGPGDSFMPVVLDLNGDGARILERSNSEAWFDFGEGGFVRQLAWADPNDAFLVYDADGDGAVSSPDELSFIGYLEGASTDLEGLAAFDSNGDGAISSGDAEWDKFSIWQDANSNGVTDDGELYVLSSTNIASVGLASDRMMENYADGSRVFGRGTFTLTDNTTHDLADVALSVSRVAVGVNEEVGSVAFRSDTLGRFDVALTDNSLNVSLDTDEIKAFMAGPNDDYIRSNGERGVVVFGAGGHDTLSGSSSNDWLFGGDGADRLEGNDGNDLLFVDAEDLGDGSVDGGSGVDIAVWDSVGPALVEFADPRFEGFVGSSSNDAVRFYGSESMLIDGLAGNDRIVAGGGDDLLVGGAGADVLKGGAGDDWLFVDSDDVCYSGGEGFDTLVVLDEHSVKVNTRKHGIERFLGGDGNDVARNRRGQESVEYFGGGGNDRLVGGSGDDYISGGLGDDKLFGRKGVDTAAFDNQAASYDLKFSRRNTLEVEGSESSGQGLDRLKRFEILEFADASFRIDGKFSKTAAGESHHVFTDAADVVQGHDGSEIVSASEGDDLVLVAGGDDVAYAGKGNDVVFGGAGRDQIHGEYGDDYLVGGVGDDLIEAGAGDDTVAGGEGNDWLDLGEGSDTALIFSESGQDTLVLGTADAAERNVIEFVESSYEDLWFERDGNSALRVSVLGTEDTLTVDDWFASESHASIIRDANGREADTASVHHLITAMATFEASDSAADGASLYTSAQYSSGSLAAYWESNTGVM